MSISELISSKKDTIDTAIKLLGYAIVISWGVSKYVSTDENKDMNMVSRVETLEKRADNSDVLHSQTNKRIDNHDVSIAVINTNMENMAAITSETNKTTKSSLVVMEEIKLFLKTNK